MREYEDFTFASQAFARRLSLQNIRYAEVFFSPVRFLDQGLEIPRLLEAIRAWLSLVPEVEVALIPDLVRDYGPERALKTLWEINDAREHGVIGVIGVIGVGLGGSEQKVPPGAIRSRIRRSPQSGISYHSPCQ